jgi:proton glutamate symport protein
LGHDFFGDLPSVPRYPAAGAPAPLIAATSQTGVGLLRFTIPSNVFEALTRDYVPAIVVFAIVYGIAFQSLANKQGLLEIFDAVRVASVRIWVWIVQLAPFGLFASLGRTTPPVARIITSGFSLKRRPH